MEFAKGGMFLDANNEKQMEGFKRFANALAVMTQGQDIGRQIPSEIKGILSGSSAPGNVMFRMLNQLDNGKLKEHLQLWQPHAVLRSLAATSLLFYDLSGQDVCLQFEQSSHPTLV